MWGRAGAGENPHDRAYANQHGHFSVPHNHNARTAATTRIAPALPGRAPSCVDRLFFSFTMAVPRRDFFAQSPRRQLKNRRNELDGPHVCSESQVVITTDTCPIDSRALDVRWVAWFGFSCYGPALRVGRTNKNREVALVRSPRPACCARLLWANQTHIRLSLAVAVGRRTEMHQTIHRSSEFCPELR